MQTSGADPCLARENKNDQKMTIYVDHGRNVTQI